MDDVTKRAFGLLREIKSVAGATVDKGMPDNRILDVMLAEDDGIYMLGVEGKAYCRQLREVPRIALVGMTSDYVMVRLIGDVEFLDDDRIVDRIFEENPMLNDLYPGDRRRITFAYRIPRGRGEIFELSTHPIRRERFAFGGEEIHPSGYVITDRCIACGICVDVCPTAAISEGDVYCINPSMCLECGSCREVCPEEAIEPSVGLS